MSEDTLPPPSPPLPEDTPLPAVMSPTPPELSTSPRGPPMPSQRLRPMPMPTTAMDWDTTDTDTVSDTATVWDTTDTDTVLDTVTMADTVWDTPVITLARGLLMPSQRLRPMLMLTTAMVDITAADTDITDVDMATHTEDITDVDTDMATTTASKPKKLPSSILHSCSDRISVLSVKRE